MQSKPLNITSLINKVLSSKPEEYETDDLRFEFREFAGKPPQELREAISKQDIESLKQIIKLNVHSQHKATSAKILTIVCNSSELPYLEELSGLNRKDNFAPIDYFYQSNELDFIRSEVVQNIALNASLKTEDKIDFLAKNLAIDTRFLPIGHYYDRGSSEAITQGQLRAKNIFRNSGCLLGSEINQLYDIFSSEHNSGLFNKHKPVIERAYSGLVNMVALPEEYTTDMRFLEAPFANLLVDLGDQQYVSGELNRMLTSYFPPTYTEINSRTVRWDLFKLANIAGDAETTKSILHVLQENPSNDWVNYYSLNALASIGNRYNFKKIPGNRLELFEDALNYLEKKMLTLMAEAHLDTPLGADQYFKAETEGLRYFRIMEIIMGQDVAAKYFAVKALSEEKDEFKFTLGWLSDKKSAFNELTAKYREGTEKEKKRAEVLLGEMGFADAVGMLVAENHRSLYIDYVAKPLKAFEEEELTYLRQTRDDMKQGFKFINYMGLVTFGVGIFIIALGSVLAVIGQNSPSQLAVGATSILAGIVTIFINFVKGPVQIVQKSISSFVQVEAAFINYIRRTSLAAFAFLREYTGSEKPDSEVLEKCTNQMNEAAKDTLALIELYSGEGTFMNKLSDPKAQELCKRVVTRESKDTQTTPQSVMPP